MTTDNARLFRSLHVPARPLVLANAWDVASARIIEDAGAAAIATTSAGVAWSLGAPDGDLLGRDLAVDLIARIARVTTVPVTADIEGGHADTPAGVTETVAAVVAVGAVGINIEDGPRPPEDVVPRIAAARAASDEVFVNARIDTFLRGLGGVPETLERATAYLAAGADGIFVPGATDPAVITALVEGIDAPVNVMAHPGAPSVKELAGLGVARVSVGSGISQSAYAVVRDSARELFSIGTYSSLENSVDYGTLNTLLTPRD
ncbi:isocitrate lyase/PEP mutase family protein [Amycolatopsis alba]|uniref:Isocitrate lyase/phosphoenolpyruvate mutase family protein n=1 Tax=Amycolatopsis alba DSM 44262 TaxID=1125972 RepID=A0A229S3B3_AMYAL|nr:isocitrate lyase/phosphoenolpyruvate mutase family protein [Amycolatopsis alba]OXM53209.1 isocitrate lyase/phosphoenolpyruvate mutase family protein [Amycolatopsis alba DSM 44262]